MTTPEIRECLWRALSKHSRKTPTDQTKAVLTALDEAGYKIVPRGDELKQQAPDEDANGWPDRMTDLICPPCPVCGHPAPVWTGHGGRAGGGQPSQAWDAFECRDCGHQWREYFLASPTPTTARPRSEAPTTPGAGSLDNPPDEQ